MSGRQSSKRKKKSNTKSGRNSRSRTPRDRDLAIKQLSHNPVENAPQNNINVVKTFLKNIKHKGKPRGCSNLGSRKNSHSQKRSNSKSRAAKAGNGMHSLTFDVKERENYNKKLDETVQRILDREKEYLEEQLLREKRESKAKDAIVNALRSDLAHLQQSMSAAINKSGVSQSFETKPSTASKKKRKRSTSTSRCQMDFQKANQENQPPSSDLVVQL